MYCNLSYNTSQFSYLINIFLRMITNNFQFENLLINYSFVFIFATVIFYWTHLILISKLNLQKLGQLSNYISNLLIFVLLILRWWKSHHIPISNLATRNLIINI